MVYDREVGAMRVLLVSPFPRPFLLFAKLLAAVLVSLLQVYVFLAIAWFWEVEAPLRGYLLLLPVLVLTGLMLGAFGLFLSSVFHQFENFATVMNFVIFPMFFASSALYPLWRMRESSPLLYEICRLNPFTYAVESIRFALYGQLEWSALAVVAAVTALFLGLAIFAYNPSKGFMVRRGGPPAAT
jgi:ABC-2 type transport system permease protein